jgi:hypothetical protein
VNYIVGRPVGGSIKRLSQHRKRRAAIEAAQRRAARGDHVAVYRCLKDGLTCRREAVVLFKQGT